MAKIKISLHNGGVFRGEYWLERIEWNGKRPSIIAHFGPVDCACGFSDAVAAAQWLVTNRIDLGRVTVESENGASFYDARKPVCA